MGWCVEKQQSWTADNPAEDVRSVRKQLRAIQDAVRAEDRETAHRVALELSGNVLNLRTEELEAKLRGQE